MKTKPTTTGLRAAMMENLERSAKAHQFIIEIEATLRDAGIFTPANPTTDGDPIKTNGLWELVDNQKGAINEMMNRLDGICASIRVLNL